MVNQNIKVLLYNLSQSKFRNSFHLSEKDVQYINQKGMKTIQNHAMDLIQKRLSPMNLVNDGKQTPMRGHPVFVAQHATATCCRKCLFKWHHIVPNKQLTSLEEKYIVNLIMSWIQKEMDNFYKTKKH